MNIIIPLGGLGQRFLDKGFVQPKSLIPVISKPMIFHLLDYLEECTNEMEINLYIIYNNLLDNHDFCNIIIQKYPHIKLLKLLNNTRGAAETIYEGIKQIKEKTMTSYKKTMLFDCDTFYTENLVKHFENKNENLVFYTKKDKKEKPLYSYIELEKDKVINIREKEKISDYANTGCYCFKNIDDLYFYCENVLKEQFTFNNEFYTSCVIHQMLQDKHIFQATQLESCSVISVGTPQELQEYMNNTNVFLFDLDGTLIETDEIYFQIWKVLLQPYNIDIDKNQFNNVIMGNNDKHVCDVLLSNVPNINIDDISKLKDKLFIEHIQNIGEIKTVKNAQEFLKEARKKYIPCSIVTNCNRKCAEAIVKILDIEKYIDFIIVGNECERTKPFPDPYITAIKKYNVRPDQVVIFEDSKSGLLSARSVSPKCLVGIETFYTNSELTQLGADISVKSFENFFVDTLLQFISLMNLDNKNLVNWILNTVKNTVPDVEKQHILINPIKLKGGYIADVLSVSIETPKGVISCVLKMENPMETPMTSVATSLDLYNREYMFYESISNAFDFSIPKFYGLVKNNEKNIGILLENLYDGSPSNKLNCNLNKNPHYAYHIIKSMAKMHVHFWNRELKQEFPFLRNTVDSLFCPSWNEFINKRKDLFKKNWCHVLSSSQMTMVDRICDNFSHIQENLANNNQTLIHGDIKSPNIFYNTETNTPFFIDWQYVGIGKGVQDLIFFLIESFDTDVLQTRFHELCNLYFTEVNKNPNVNYKREDFNRDLQNAVCYFPFFVAVWFGTVPSEDLIDKEFPLQFIKKLFFVLTTFFHNL